MRLKLLGKKMHRYFYFFIIILLMNCSNTQKSLPLSTIRETIVQIEKRPIAYPINNNTIDQHLQLLQLYTLIDDQPGQLKTLLFLANARFQMGQEDEAKQTLYKAQEIAKRVDLKHYNYQLALLSGRIEQQFAQFQIALQYANNPLQKALALTYLGKNTAARELVVTIKPLNLLEAIDLGFIHYRYARKTYDNKAAKQAFFYYQAADYSPGIVDSLMLLGLINQKNNNRVLAINYFKRALAVSHALKDDFRIQAIENKLRTF